MRFAVLLTSLLAMLSFASERGVKVSLSTGQTLDLYGDSFALVVGVSDYTAGWPNLNSVNSEADEISALLREQGFKVTSVKNPDSDSLEDALRTLLTPMATTREIDCFSTSQATDLREQTTLKAIWFHLTPQIHQGTKEGFFVKLMP